MSKRSVLWNSFVIFLLLATLIITFTTQIATGGPPTRDVAVTKITLLYNTTVVFPTWQSPLNITVTVKNNGSKAKETFDVNAYYHEFNETLWNPIDEMQTVRNLDNGTETNVTFAWDCRNLAGYPDDPDIAWPYPVYEIKANATLAEDQNPKNNKLINGNVTVQWLGDCNGDGYVNDVDMAILQDAYEGAYDPRADFNGDGNVDFTDLHSLGLNWHMGPLEAHDVAVVNITFSYDTTVVFPTWQSPLNISVKVKNKGWAYNETFTVTVYNGTTPIGTQNVTDLGPGAEETKTFTWELPTWDKYPNNRTEAWPYPNHTIKANASIVDKETKIDDNVYFSTLTVQWPGDCNGDGYVNDVDMAILENAYCYPYPNPNYTSTADFNGDGHVDWTDLTCLGLNWHKGPRDRIDVAVTNITLSYDTTVVYTNCSLQIYVTVKNNGTQTETFNVALYANSTEIDTKEVTLTSGNFLVITFTWNIPDATWPYLNYTLNAKATLLTDENPTNNELVDGTLTVRWPGDCNGDGYVNATDLLSPYFRDDLDVYNPRSDFNGDGIVDTEDAKILIDHWETGP